MYLTWSFSDDGQRVSCFDRIDDDVARRFGVRCRDNAIRQCAIITAYHRNHHDGRAGDDDKDNDNGGNTTIKWCTEQEKRW